jgi:DNA-binding CsgD family transcriptional regulator/PAS domain-containing protein
MIQNRDKRLLNLIELIYAAALDKSEWTNFLVALQEVLGGAGIIFSQDFRTAAASIFAETGFGPDAIAQYVAYFADMNPWTPQLERLNIPSLVTVTGEDLLESRTYEATEFYNDWMKPMRAYWMIAGQVLKEKSIGTALSFARSPSRGPFSIEEQEFFNQLLPHMARAAQIHRHLFALDLTKRASEHALDGLEIALLIVDGQACILFANAPAERLLAEDKGIQRRDSRLRAALPHDSEMLQHAIASAVHTASGEGCDAAGLVPVRRSGAEPLLAMVSPLLSDKPAFGTNEPAALVLVSDPSRRSRPREEDLTRLYGLTKAEAMLLSALIDGERLNDFAERKGITLATAKTQLQHIFDRMGQNRQADLVRHVLLNPILNLRR